MLPVRISSIRFPENPSGKILLRRLVMFQVCEIIYRAQIAGIEALVIAGVILGLIANLKKKGWMRKKL